MALCVAHSISALHVIQMLERLREEGGLSDCISCDNGSESTSRAFDAWTYSRDVKIEYIQPGKPVQNCLADSLIASFRGECFILNWFLSLSDARRMLQRSRRDYSRVPPHSAPGDLPRAEFALNWNGWIGSAYHLSPTCLQGVRGRAWRSDTSPTRPEGSMDRDGGHPKGQDAGQRNHSGVERAVRRAVARTQSETQAVPVDRLFSMTGKELGEAAVPGPESEERFRRLRKFLADHPNALDESLNEVAEAEAQVPDSLEDGLVAEIDDDPHGSQEP